jgi:hypothetical protein
MATNHTSGESFNLPVPTITVNNVPVLGSAITKVDRYTYLHVGKAGEKATITLGTKAGTQVRYSLNGEDPSHNSKLYTAPVVLDGNIVTIKARAYNVVNGKVSPNEKSPLIVAQFATK